MAAGSHASTFGGNPVACAAASATIRLLKDTLVANAADVGAYMLAGLAALADRHPLIGDVRGKGLMIGVELVKDRRTKERATKERDAVVEQAFQRGLLILGAGRNALRLSPPLVLTRAQADTAVRILDDAIGAVEQQFGYPEPVGERPALAGPCSWSGIRRARHWRDGIVVRDSWCPA